MSKMCLKFEYSNVRQHREMEAYLLQSMVIGHPVHAGLSPMMIGNSLIVKSPKVTCFVADMFYIA